MGTDTTFTGKGKGPLTREDVERRLAEAGTSERLDLNGEILRGVDLRRFDLHGANLNLADLSKANLSRANLSLADLSRADLSRADLSDTDLSRANLEGANLEGALLGRAVLSGAHLKGADLRGANLSGAHLEGANLSGAYLRGANMEMTNLREADLSGANLEMTNLREAGLRAVHLLETNLMWADLSGVDLSAAEVERAKMNHATLYGARITAEQYTELHKVGGIIGLDTAHILSALTAKGFPQYNAAPPGSPTPDEALPLSLRILEEPLTASITSTILASFTELHTKCWLIQQGRFADLMDYTQTHQPRFALEANLRITRLSYNSPALILFGGIGQAVGEVLSKTIDAIQKTPKESIDAVMQAPERKKAAQLKNEAAAQTLDQQRKEAQFQHEDQIHELLFREHLRTLEVRERELALREREIELREREAASQQQIAEARVKTLDTLLTYGLHMAEQLQPNALPQLQEIAARSLLPQLLTFSQMTGVEVTLLAEAAPPQEGNPPTPSADAAS